MNQTQNTFPSEQLTLSENAIGYLKTAGKWAKFLAILNFIGLALLFLAAMGMIAASIFVSSQIEQPLPFVFLGLLYLVLAAIGIIPAVYLFKFATNTGKMAAFRDNLKLEESLKYLMSYYRFIGIMTIIIMGIYLLAVVIGLVIGIGSMAYLMN